jgi:hypothetical protein
MTDFKEEAYVLEKMEISEDEDDGFEYNEIKDSEADDQIEDLVVDSMGEDEDDLNDFNALKTNTVAKKLAAAAGASQERGTKIVEAVPKTLNRDVVIDDFIRNFMQKFRMSKTLNIFQ